MQGFVCRIRSLNGVPCPFLISVAAKMNGPPAAVVAATTSAADTNFLYGNREWFRLQRLWRRRVPRPILIFAAAKKNGPPTAGVAATTFCVRF